MFRCWFCSVVVTLVVCGLAESVVAEEKPSWKVGDKVEAFNGGWFPAVIKTVGEYGGKAACLVKFDKYDMPAWVNMEDIRARAVAPAPAAAAKVSLAMGKYQCAVLLGSTYTPVATFVLKADGTYETSTGKGGKYEHDVAAKRVKFTGGALEDSVGRVEAGAGQTPPVIRLNKKADLSESEFTQNLRAQICSPVK